MELSAVEESERLDAEEALANVPNHPRSDEDAWRLAVAAFGEDVAASVMYERFIVRGRANAEATT